MDIGEVRVTQPAKARQGPHAVMLDGGLGDVLRAVVRLVVDVGVVDGGEVESLDTGLAEGREVGVVGHSTIDLEGQRIGERREGIYFGMSAGLVKLAFSFQGILYSIIFTISGYVAGAEVQSASAVWGIRFLMGASPIIACALGAWACSKYPIRFKGNQPASSTT